MISARVGNSFMTRVRLKYLVLLLLLMLYAYVLIIIALPGNLSGTIFSGVVFGLAILTYVQLRIRKRDRAKDKDTLIEVIKESLNDCKDGFVRFKEEFKNR
jgi:hypothetical protein